MNKEQRAYAIAKAYLETLEAQARKIEHDYIIAHGIRNPDGTVPSEIYQIEDESVFDSANQGCACIDELGIYEARESLRAAEDALIHYGVALAPASVRAQLESVCFGPRRRYDYRQKVIDLTFKLDVSTVPRRR